MGTATESQSSLEELQREAHGETFVSIAYPGTYREGNDTMRLESLFETHLRFHRPYEQSLARVTQLAVRG